MQLKVNTYLCEVNIALHYLIFEKTYDLEGVKKKLISKYCENEK